jgi:hypothetical protein
MIESIMYVLFGFCVLAFFGVTAFGAMVIFAITRDRPNEWLEKLVLDPLDRW